MDTLLITQQSLAILPLIPILIALGLGTAGVVAVKGKDITQNIEDAAEAAKTPLIVGAIAAAVIAVVVTNKGLFNKLLK